MNSEVRYYLPTFEQCMKKIETGSASALEKFIYEHDDADPERSDEFFSQLKNVLAENRNKALKSIQADLLNFRDSVLNNRHQLQDWNDSDKTNDVLGLFDDIFQI
jgi:molecular chaperone GrpE (heat shock protein)